MPAEIRHGTHWGVWQCQRRIEGSCQVCRDFRAAYQRELRAAKRERRLQRAATKAAGERTEQAQLEHENECEPYCWCRRLGGHVSTAMRWTPLDPIARFPAQRELEAA
jgi:hypothetical protein